MRAQKNKRKKKHTHIETVCWNPRVPPFLSGLGIVPELDKPPTMSSKLYILSPSSWPGRSLGELSRRCMVSVRHVRDGMERGVSPTGVCSDLLLCAALVNDKKMNTGNNKTVPYSQRIPIRSHSGSRSFSSSSAPSSSSTRSRNGFHCS